MNPKSNCFTQCLSAQLLQTTNTADSTVQNRAPSDTTICSGHRFFHAQCIIYDVADISQKTQDVILFLRQAPAHSCLRACASRRERDWSIEVVVVFQAKSNQAQATTKHGVVHSWLELKQNRRLKINCPTAQEEKKQDKGHVN